MGSCSSLTVRRSEGEDTGSSCSLDHGQSCRQSEEVTVCLVCGVVRWNRGGKQRTTVPDVTGSLLTGRYAGCGGVGHRWTARCSSKGESGNVRWWRSGARGSRGPLIDGQSLIIDGTGPSCLDPATHQGRCPRAGCTGGGRRPSNFLDRTPSTYYLGEKRRRPRTTHSRVDTERPQLLPAGNSRTRRSPRSTAGDTPRLPDLR